MTSINCMLSVVNAMVTGIARLQCVDLLLSF